MVEQKKRRREGTDTEPALVKALRQEVEELKIAKVEAGDPPASVKALRQEVEGLKLRKPKVEAESQTQKEKEKEVKLPTRAWAIIAGKIHPNDVCSFALVSKQLREAQVRAGRELVTRPYYFGAGGFTVAYFTEDWCAYWSRKCNVHHTDFEVIKRVLYVAAGHGYLQVFEKYWSQGPQEKLSKLWDEHTCSWAAFHGHLEVIKWLRAKECPWGIAASANAAYSGHLEVLQWMRAQGPPCPWDSYVCYYAAGNGHLEVLRWARSQGCPWHEDVPFIAARCGHLEVLVWLMNEVVEQKKRRREGTDTEPASVKALRQEIEGLKLKIAKVEAGCQAPQEKDKEVKLPTELWAIIAGKLDKNDVCSFALVSKQLREAQVRAGRELVTKPYWKRDGWLSSMYIFTEDWCAYWSRKFNVHHTDPELIKRVLYIAARHGYLQVFEKYWSQGPQEKLSKLWDDQTCGWAARGGHLEVLKWLRAKGCPCGTLTSCWAAQGGRLEVMKWLRAKGCPWGTWASSRAAKGGHLVVLQWMRAQDPPCPWNSDVCYYAASKGHLEVLRWARSQGCPWDGRAPRDAAGGGHLEVLVWLIKEGCPCSKRKCRKAALKGEERARKVLEWLDD